MGTASRDLRKKFVPAGNRTSQVGGEETPNVLPPIMIASGRKGRGGMGQDTQRSASFTPPTNGQNKRSREGRVIRAASSLPDFVSDPVKQKECMDTLTHYCVIEKNQLKKNKYRTAALENGFGKACALILSIHIEDKTVVRRCLRCLQMGGTPMQIYKHLMTYRVHERVFAALLRYSKDSIIVERALAAFFMLVVCPAVVQYLYQAKLHGEDFISLLCRVMIEYNGDRFIQLYGCSLITTLLASADRKLKKKLIFQYELVDLVVKAMRRFQGSADVSDAFHDAELQHKAVFALLYAHDHFYYQMVDGVGEVTTTVLREHYKNNKLVLKFCHVLTRLVESNCVAVCLYRNDLFDCLKLITFYSMGRLQKVTNFQNEKELKKSAELIETMIQTSRLISKLLSVAEIYEPYIKSDEFEKDIDFFAELLSCKYLRAFQISEKEIEQVSSSLRQPVGHLVTKTAKIGEWGMYLMTPVLMKNPVVIEKMVRKYFWRSVVDVANAFQDNIGIQVKMVKVLSEFEGKLFPPPPPLKKENATAEVNLNPKRFENSLYTTEGLEDALNNANLHFEENKTNNKNVNAGVKNQLKALIAKAREIEI